MAPKDEPKNLIQAALDNAAKELERAISFQEKGALRIIQLAEHLESIARDNISKDQARLIIKTCDFQDLTGQRIRAVIKSLSAVAEQVKKLDTSGVAAAPKEKSTKELDQDEINRLLAGESVKAVKNVK